jgi:hypothetical protein
LVSSGQVVSEENIFSNCVRTDDRRKVMTKAHFGSGELKKKGVHIISYPWSNLKKFMASTIIS